ncbi:1953_t:CDS:1, partial [Dentiscutata erythropus]
LTMGGTCLKQDVYDFENEQDPNYEQNSNDEWDSESSNEDK